MNDYALKQMFKSPQEKFLCESYNSKFRNSGNRKKISQNILLLVDTLVFFASFLRSIFFSPGKFLIFHHHRYFFFAVSFLRISRKSWRSKKIGFFFEKPIFPEVKVFHHFLKPLLLTFSIFSCCIHLEKRLKFHLDSSRTNHTDGRGSNWPDVQHISQNFNLATKVFCCYVLDMFSHEFLLLA